MFRRLCSQKRISASSPLTLHRGNGDEKLSNHSADVMIIFHPPTNLTSSQAWKTASKATWSEKRLPEKFLWTNPRRFPSLMKGSGKQEAAEIVQTASPTLQENTKELKQTKANRQALTKRAETDLNMQPMIIIFPNRGSMGSRARIRPRGVSSSLLSRASSSGTQKHTQKSQQSSKTQFKKN